jgi:hypothetical protein
MFLLVSLQQALRVRWNEQVSLPMTKPPASFSPSSTFNRFRISFAALLVKVTAVI